MRKKIILAFPGQGSQYQNMGIELMRRSTRAREIFERANQVLGFDLSEIVKDSDTLTRTEYAQPAILTHSIAALERFKEEHAEGTFEIDTCVGHSLGEFTALVASECLSLEDGVRLVRGRGEAMAKASKESLHKMIALMPTRYDDKRLKLLLESVNNENRDEICEVANVNSRNQIVLSGTRFFSSEAIEQYIYITHAQVPQTQLIEQETWH